MPFYYDTNAKQKRLNDQLNEILPDYIDEFISNPSIKTGRRIILLLVYYYKRRFTAIPSDVAKLFNIIIDKILSM